MSLACFNGFFTHFAEIVQVNLAFFCHQTPSTLPLSVMCHFAYFAFEENKAGPLRHAEAAASADWAKLWHNPLLLLWHFTSPFLFCSVQKTGSLPRLESVACFLYGHVVFSFYKNGKAFYQSFSFLFRSEN